MKLTTDRHEVSRGLFATAELLVGNCWTVIVSIGSLFYIHNFCAVLPTDKPTKRGKNITSVTVAVIIIHIIVVIVVIIAIIGDSLPLASSCKI